MVNVTLSLDKELLEQGRAYAKSQDLSLNALIREMIQQRTMTDTQWVDDALSLSDSLQARSDDRGWTRDELYRY